MNNVTPVGLLRDFSTQYASKYIITSEEPIGGGAYGTVFKAKDIDRDLDVAIKLYNEGLVPAGSERGWNLSSKTINHQIAPTYTIENFTSRGAEFKAVVSRFIPGKSLRSTFEWCNNQSPENKSRIADDLAFSFLPSLLEVLELCHSLRFGHGDLHDGNVMIVPTDISNRFEFSAVLIDFDNSSIQQNVFCSTEKEKIEKDCRLFASRLGPYILMDWAWEKEVGNIFKSYNKIGDIRIAFDAILRFVELVKSNSVTQKNVLYILSNLVPYQMNSFAPKATVDSLKAIAQKAGLGRQFADFFAVFEERLRDVSNMTVEVTIIEDGHIKNPLYKNFFG